MMHRFGDQIELRVDRRHVLLFFLGALLWTLIAFFLGMFSAGNGRVRFSEKGLSALGWLDKNAMQRNAALFAAKSKPVAFSFVEKKPKKRLVQVQQKRHVLKKALFLEKTPKKKKKSSLVSSKKKEHIVSLRKKKSKRSKKKSASNRKSKGVGFFAVEMRFINPKKAELLNRLMRKRGYHPRLSLTRYQPPKRGRYYQVLMGRFKTRRAARLFWQKVKMPAIKGGVIRIAPKR